MKNICRQVCNYFISTKSWIVIVLISLWTLPYSLTVYASDISSSILATGTEKLVKDATTWLLVIAPAITIIAVIYYFIRKGMADEMDHRKWNTRISTAIISCIGVVTASIIIKVIIAYYQ